VRELVFLTLANHLPRLRIFDKIRFLVYRWAGVRVQGKCMIWGPLIIRPIGGARNISIGKGTFINTEVRFGVPRDMVTIGEHVHIGPRVMFETVNHSLKYDPTKGRSRCTRPIVVEERVWIGAGAIISQGVTIGHGSVVAAGAVVTKDVQPNVVVGGIPAKKIRDLSDDSPVTIS